MRLPMMFFVWGRVHLALGTKGAAFVELDVELIEHSEEGDPEVLVRWNLPGTAFDSGPTPLRVRVPASAMHGSLVTFVAAVLLAAGAPTAFVTTVKDLMK